MLIFSISNIHFLLTTVTRRIYQVLGFWPPLLWLGISIYFASLNNTPDLREVVNDTSLESFIWSLSLYKPRNYLRPNFHHLISWTYLLISLVVFSPDVKYFQKKHSFFILVNVSKRRLLCVLPRANIFWHKCGERWILILSGLEGKEGAVANGWRYSFRKQLGVRYFFVLTSNYYTH